MTQLHTLISSLEQEWQGCAQTHKMTGQCLWFTQSRVKRCRSRRRNTYYTHSFWSVCWNILTPTAETRQTVKVGCILAEHVIIHQWKLIPSITVVTTFYIVVIIIATDSITIIINTVICNHQAHHKPYFFYNEWDGQSVAGDEAVLGYVHTKHVCSTLVEL